MENKLICENISKILKKIGLQNIVKEDIKKINEIRETYNLDKLDNIEDIKLINIDAVQKKVNSKRKETGGLFKKICKDKNKEKEENSLLNDYLNELNKNIKISNREKNNKIEALNSIEVKNFLKRKLFVNYTEFLISELRENKCDQISAFCYNVEKSVSNIKIDEDSWFLANNFIKRECISPNLDLESKNYSKYIMNLINKCEDNYYFNKTIVKIYNENSIVNKIKNDKDLSKMMNLIDELILDFIEILDSVLYEENNNEIVNKLEALEMYEKLAKDLGYEKIELKPLQDRLNVEFCTTLEVNETNDLEKDFLISKVHKNGFKNGKTIVRRSIVDVYRFKEI